MAAITRTQKGSSRQELLAAADTYQAQNDLPRLASTLKQLTDLLPQSASIHERFARTLLALGAYPDAESAMRRVLELNKSPNAEFLQWYGYCLTQRQKYSQAIEALKAALAKGKPTPETLVLLAEALHFTGDETEAENTIAEAKRLYPQSAMIYYSHTLMLFSLGRFTEAITSIRHAITLGDNSHGTNLMLGRSCIATCDLDSGYEALKRAFPANPLSVDFSDIWLGDVVKSVGLDKAIEWHARPDIDDFVRQYHLSCLLLQAGRSDDAAETLSKVKAIKPEAREVIGLTGRIAAVRGDWRTACAQADILWDYAARVTKAGQRPKIPPPSTLQPGVINRLVYVAVEIEGREFESRLKVAFRAAEKGIFTVIASSHMLYYAAADMPVGIYLLKTLNYYDSLKISSLKGTGHRFIALDEEQLSSYGSDQELVVGTDPNITAAVDIIMANNKAHASALINIFPELVGKVVVTGNPRIELLNSSHSDAYLRESDEIKAKFGEAVLICTNFGGFASTTLEYERICMVMLEALNRSPATPAGQAIVQQGRDYSLSEARSIAAMAAFVPELTKAFPNLKFVIRTHPAESPAIWKNKFAGLDNVVVMPGGSLQGWLRAVKAVVYFAGCMTGVEARLANVPAVRFDVDPELRFPRCGLSAHINPAAANGPQLVERLQEIFAHGRVAAHDYEADDKVLSDKLLVPEPSPSQRCVSVIETFLDGAAGKAVTAESVSIIEATFANAAAQERMMVTRGARLIEAKKLKITLQGMQDKLRDHQGVSSGLSSVVIKQLADGAFLIGPRAT